jgi:hypothetical protein
MWNAFGVTLVSCLEGFCSRRHQRKTLCGATCRRKGGVDRLFGASSPAVGTLAGVGFAHSTRGVKGDSGRQVYQQSERQDHERQSKRVEYVYYQYRGKGGKQRSRVLPQPALAAIERSLADCGKSLTAMRWGGDEGTPRRDMFT